MRVNVKEKVALLLMSDVVAMAVSFIIALVLGHRLPFTFDLVSYYNGGAETLIASAVVVFFILDVYSLHKIPERFLGQALLVVVGLLLGAILSTFTFFFTRDAVPRAVFLLFYVFSFLLINLFRYAVSRATLSAVYWRLLIVGKKAKCLDVGHMIESRQYLHSTVVGYLTDDQNSGEGKDIPCLGRITDLMAVAEQRGIDQIIVAAATIEEDLTKYLLECMQKKIKISDFRKVIEDITGKVPIDYLNDNWFILWLSTADKRYFWYVKRCIDIVLSAFGFCFSLPFVALAALLIKLDSRGPVFYSQQRVGRGNKPFRAWKLRTMVEGADKNRVHWTTENDDRITRVGRLLRKMRLDEVPQLLNVLRGDMSLIGPRPEATSLVERYVKEIPYYPERHMVSPGLTGWAQINYPYGNSLEDTRQKLMYDFYYIKNRRFTLDVMIFLRTIRTVLTGKGAI